MLACETDPASVSREGLGALQSIPTEGHQGGPAGPPLIFEAHTASGSDLGLGQGLQMAFCPLSPSAGTVVAFVLHCSEEAVSMWVHSLKKGLFGQREVYLLGHLLN